MYSRSRFIIRKNSANFQVLEFFSYKYFSASGKVHYKKKLTKAVNEYETILLGELTRRRHPRSSWSFQEQMKVIMIKISQVSLMSRNGKILTSLNQVLS